MNRETVIKLNKFNPHQNCKPSITYKEADNPVPPKVEIFGNSFGMLKLHIEQGEQQLLISLNYCPICGVRGENIDEYRNSSKAE